MQALIKMLDLFFYKTAKAIILNSHRRWLYRKLWEDHRRGPSPLSGGVCLDFSGADLRYADFSAALMSHSSFGATIIRGGGFHGATLDASDFSGAKIRHCIIDNADFHGTLKNLGNKDAMLDGFHVVAGMGQNGVVEARLHQR